jgi:hypothetical protein
MKKNLTVLLAVLLIGGTAFGQAVSDRNIIPVAVNLNQVLRMTITNGGNIEFVFNTIDEYKDGISGDVATSGSANDAAGEGMYRTDFTVSSSTRWKIVYGAESATFLGVDDPTNTLDLNNVGFTILSNAVGGHIFESTGPQGTTATEELWDEQRNAEAGTDGAPAALDQYPANLIEDNNSATQANAGDASDNDFTLIWRCGTGESTNTVIAMDAEALIDQQPSPNPDRYVANVLFELSVDN